MVRQKKKEEKNKSWDMLHVVMKLKFWRWTLQHEANEGRAQTLTGVGTMLQPTSLRSKKIVPLETAPPKINK